MITPSDIDAPYKTGGTADSYIVIRPHYQDVHNDKHCVKPKKISVQGANRGKGKFKKDWQ